MSRDLEALLESFHAIKEASARDVEACEALYHARLEEISAQRKISKEVLHQMILRSTFRGCARTPNRVLFRRKPDRGGFGVPELVKKLFCVAPHKIVQGGIVASRQPRHVVCIPLIADGSIHGAGLLVRLASHPLLLLAGRRRR